MATEVEIKRQVRDFYDQIGWQEASNGFYQNASYEDLRPVSHEYIHDCHMRVMRHLNPDGHILLDAGSGPIQYPEYLEYSRGYHHRLCADISMLALQEARKRIGSHGFFVVCDIAHLPFTSNTFDGMVSLHTIHHLPPEDHIGAYQELHRTLAAGGKGVVVNGWDDPPLARLLKFWIKQIKKLYALLHPHGKTTTPVQASGSSNKQPAVRGTYVHKNNASYLKREVGRLMPVQIWCWRSVNVHFLRIFIHEKYAGRQMLRFVYWMEERFPHFFGKYGQYPLIVISKHE